MSFDNFITIGIIIYVIYSIKKALSSGKNGSGDKRKNTGWAGKLADFMNNIKKEIEKANQQAMAEKPSDPKDDASSFWDDISKPSPEKETSSSKTINQTLFYETKKNELPPAIEKEIEIPEVPVENHRNYHGTHDKPEQVCAKQNSTSRCFKMKKADLRKAVIWSEIISKPISLRD